jgi:hypothetical protein
MWLSRREFKPEVAVYEYANFSKGYGCGEVNQLTRTASKGKEIRVKTL